VTGTVFSVTPASLSVPAGQTGMLTVKATVPQASTAGAALSGSLSLTTSSPARPSRPPSARARRARPRASASRSPTRATPLRRSPSRRPAGCSPSRQLLRPSRRAQARR
jgi:hypothetical protein